MKSTAGVLFVLVGILCLWFCHHVGSKIIDEHAKITQAFFCQDSRAQLVCPRGQVIKVHKANYGHTAGASVCPPTSTDVTDCSAPSSMPLVHCKCHNKHSCELSASNHLFGDPCNSTSKYLQVDFSCMGTHTVKCGNSSNSCVIGCPANHTLDIEFASFGGRDTSLGEPNQYTKERCTFWPAYYILDDCHGENHCTYDHHQLVNGIRCLQHSYKYLEIHYKCV